MLLTVDPGKFLGWTLGPLSADAPASDVAFGSVRLADTTDLGAYLASADEHLQDLFGRGVTRWAIEVPNTKKGTSHASIVKGVALYGHVMYWARLMQLPPPVVFSPTEIKLALTGNGAAKKGDKAPEMENAARALGYAVQNDHEADAVAIRRAFTHGVPESKSERAKREAAERRAAREAAKGPALL